MKDEIKCIRVHLNDEEKAKLMHDAALCGLTQTEYLRQLCLNKQPHPCQPDAFWVLMNALYDLHGSFQKLIPYYPDALQACHKIEKLILHLQEVA